MNGWMDELVDRNISSRVTGRKITGLHVLPLLPLSLNLTLIIGQTGLTKPVISIVMSIKVTKTMHTK